MHCALISTALEMQLAYTRRCCGVIVCERHNVMIKVNETRENDSRQDEIFAHLCSRLTNKGGG